MAVAMQGLKLKPKYDYLINAAVSDGPEHIKNPLIEMHNFLTKRFCLKSIRWRRDEGDGKTTRTSKQRII